MMIYLQSTFYIRPKRKKKKKNTMNLT